MKNRRKICPTKALTKKSTQSLLRPRRRTKRIKRIRKIPIEKERNPQIKKGTRKTPLSINNRMRIPKTNKRESRETPKKTRKKETAKNKNRKLDRHSVFFYKFLKHFTKKWRMPFFTVKCFFSIKTPTEGLLTDFLTMF